MATVMNSRRDMIRAAINAIGRRWFASASLYEAAQAVEQWRQQNMSEVKEFDPSEVRRVLDGAGFKYVKVGRGGQHARGVGLTEEQKTELLVRLGVVPAEQAQRNGEHEMPKPTKQVKPDKSVQELATKMAQQLSTLTTAPANSQLLSGMNRVMEQVSSALCLLAAHDGDGNKAIKTLQRAIDQIAQQAPPATEATETATTV